MTEPGFKSDARDHVATTARAMERLLADVQRLELWGEQLALVLTTGGRLLAAGNGGSAAQAQHLTSELVGRYLDERRPLSALALHAESSSVTAILNDYGADDVFARQVRAHGRPGDVLILLSTSGRSPNLVHAVHAARETGMTVWALTGPCPNPLAELADDTVSVDTARAAVVQEVHQLAVHLVCEAIECALPRTARHAEVARA
jgi:D-sedoheptulose 7-phosphate isomerase